MRLYTIECWLKHHNFRHAGDVARLLITDVGNDDVAACLFIVQAAHWIAARDGGLDVDWGIEHRLEIAHAMP